MSVYRRSVVAVATVSFLAGGATSAVAYWTIAGGGSGESVAGAVQPVTIAPGVPGSSLFPGAQVAVDVAVSNPNEGAARLASLVLDASQGNGGFAVDPAHSACDVSALSFASQDNGGAGWDLPPRVGATDGTLAISLPAALSMSATAANACQGASFTVYLKSGSS